MPHMAAPLRDKDRGIGRYRLVRQQEMFKGGGGLGFEGICKVRNQKADQQIEKSRIGSRVPKGQPHRLPEERGKVIFFNFFPGCRNGLVFCFALSPHPGKQLHQDVEYTRLVCPADDSQHFKIQVFFLVIHIDQLFEAADSVLAVEKLASQGNVLAHGLPGQAKFVHDNGGAVGVEGAAIQANIEQPVGLWFWFQRVRIEQVFASQVYGFQTHLEGQGALLLKLDDVYTVQFE